MSGINWIDQGYTARWEDRLGHWRLVVRRCGGLETVDSVVTGALTTGPHPGDEWLGKLEWHKGIPFVPAADSEWEPDGKAWRRDVRPARQWTRRH